MQTDAINFAAKTQLLDSLLACPAMQDRQTRDAIVSALKNVQGISRSDIDRTDVANIVERVLDFPGSMNQLGEVLRFYEGDSVHMQRFDALYTQHGVTTEATSTLGKDNTDRVTHTSVSYRKIWVLTGLLLLVGIMGIGWPVWGRFAGDILIQSPLPSTLPPTTTSTSSPIPPTLTFTPLPTATSRAESTFTPLPMRTPVPANANTLLLSITNLNANIRTGPGITYELISTALRGTPLNIVGVNPNGDWYLLDTGGWIADFLIDNAPTNLPIITPPPMPTPTSTITTLPTSTLLLIPVPPTSTFNPIPPTATAMDIPILLTATDTATVMDMPILPTSIPTSTFTPVPPTPTLGIGSTYVNPVDGATYVYVPAGEFIMGSSDAQVDYACELFWAYVGSDCNPSWYEDEQRQHSVYLDSYWIMETEVTNAQYRKFMDAGGYTTEAYWSIEGWAWRTENNVTQPRCWADSDNNGLQQPVVCITWYEAEAYANWLSVETGLGFGLPTEAQWEKAARGTDGRIYPWGNQWDGSKTNGIGNDDGYQYTAPVASYSAGVSPYGALDMAGNVWEWTADWYNDNYYETAPSNNPLGPTSGTRRVVRGGSRNNNPNNLRSAYRGRNYSDPRITVGFRLRLVRHESSREN